MTSSPYADLTDALDEQYEKTARFVRAAFHVHSVDSYDWGKDADAAQNERSQFQGATGQDLYLDKLVAAGLEVVCITDHMKSGYACELAKRASARSDITVFPGMEISCAIPPGHSEHIHVLAVFPADTTADVIDRIFADTSLPGGSERDGREKATFPSLSAVRDRVANAAGMFILAHLDQQSQGHRCYVRSVRGESAKMFALDPQGKETVTAISNEYAEHLVALNPHAVEVMKSSDRQHYWDFQTADGTTHTFPCLARSDFHAVGAFSNKDAVTHIKVSQTDIDCIKRALVFHDTRVRFTDDLPATPSPRIIGLRLRSATTGAALFDDATIAFNENLNCLIGPRGSGKSTVIEALRYVLGQRPLLDTARQAGGTSSYAGLALATLDANLQDCEIELIYERDGERKLLTAAYDPDAPASSRVLTLDGVDCHVGLDALQSLFPARIFSWGELETLGRRHELQRMVLDRLVSGLPPLRGRDEQLKASLAANRQSIIDMRNELSRQFGIDNGALSRYTEYEAAYTRLNTPEVAELFADLDRVRSRLEVLVTAEKNLSQMATDIERIQGATPEVDIAGLIDEQPEDLQKWWATDVAPKLALGSLTKDVDAHTSALLVEINQRRSIIAELTTVQQSAADKAEDALREQTHADAGTSVRREQREQARRQYARATEIRDNYLALFGRLDEALAVRDGLLNDLETVRTDISEAREATAKELGERLSDLGQNGQTITIEVTTGGDRGAFITYLDEFLNLERGGQYRSKALPRRLARVVPIDLARAIIDCRSADIATVSEDVSPDEAERLVNAFDLFPTDENGGVKRVSDQLDEILRLQEQPIDDLVSIMSDGQPVHELSPGGRSSAMLPLIALSDTVPLIIDQPEDNLDNRMVGRTLSSILSKLKEQRQIIVTTHNPNIVVGGDAEQVVVLDAPTARSAQVELTGSIDDDQIIRSVIKIMEGGKEAFKERERRYRDHLAL
jgi:energy-coupling factor transporter ATP-binding protein EcfA2